MSVPKSAATENSKLNDIGDNSYMRMSNDKFDKIEKSIKQTNLSLVNFDIIYSNILWICNAITIDRMLTNDRP